MAATSTLMVAALIVNTIWRGQTLNDTEDDPFMETAVADMVVADTVSKDVEAIVVVLPTSMPERLPLACFAGVGAVPIRSCVLGPGIIRSGSGVITMIALQVRCLKSHCSD